jgi:3-hydroxyisobutyrate dehydrogenase
LAARCDVIFLCLPSSDTVRATLFSEGGLAAACGPGTLVVDQTTGDPTVTRDSAAQLAQSGVELIDAPVSGGPFGADAGTIAIMVGAEPEQFDRIEPILRVISSNVFHAGALGAGQVIKIVNNLMAGGHRALTIEALALAVKSGVDAHKAYEVIMASSGRNFFVETFVESILAGQLGSGFTLSLMHKDMRLACQLGTDAEVPLFFANVAKEFYQVCINELGGGAGANAAALVMDRLAGTHVVPEGSAP